jgi:hypothetical protein
MQAQPPVTNPDLPLFDVPFMLSASKRLSYRRSTLAMAEAIANVFTDEGLSAVDLRARLIAQGPAFKAMLSELAPEGISFHRASFHAWLRKTDRWTTERTIEKLEASLRKEVAAHRAASAIPADAVDRSGG